MTGVPSLEGVYGGVYPRGAPAEHPRCAQACTRNVNAWFVLNSRFDLLVCAIGVMNRPAPDIVAKRRLRNDNVYHRF
jgi:hypothetical protein